eukprot:scaffold207977_cov55-Attheya_sp.AAC.7
MTPRNRRLVSSSTREMQEFQTLSGYESTGIPCNGGSARQILEEIFAIAKRATRITEFICLGKSSILPSCWGHHHGAISHRRRPSQPPRRTC